MAVFAPFEYRPAVAAAVSGGADSMSLALLAKDWIGSMGGRLYALTVDHRLRTESAAEARQVGQWLAAHGIAHHVLQWTGERPSSGLQEAARQARYRLLENWCEERGILHLLVGHHADDQAETIEMRRDAGSGARGLSGMAAVTERRSLRILRPLLKVRRAAIRTFLDTRGQEWIEDPSNRDPRFARARLRRADRAKVDFRLADRAAESRRAMEREVAQLCCACAAVFPSGYATLDPGVLELAPPESVKRVLAAVISAVGGRPYPPRSARLDRLSAAVTGGLTRARTLAGCRIALARRTLLISREERAVAAPIRVPKRRSAIWDQRFLAHSDGPMAENVQIGKVGRAGLAQMKDAGWTGGACVPGSVRPTLPAIWRGDTVLLVPHLGYKRIGAESAAAGIKISFIPPLPLCPPEFGIV